MHCQPSSYLKCFTSDCYNAWLTFVCCKVNLPAICDLNFVHESTTKSGSFKLISFSVLDDNDSFKVSNKAANR